MMGEAILLCHRADTALESTRYADLFMRLELWEAKYNIRVEHFPV